MQSPPSKKSIFELPELVEHIAYYLTRPDIPQCLLTCRLFRSQFEPYLYRELSVQQDSHIYQAVWRLSHWAGPNVVEREPLNSTYSDALVQVAKQYALGMEARWEANLSSVRTVVATCHSGILFDILTSDLVDDPKPSEEYRDNKYGGKDSPPTPPHPPLPGSKGYPLGSTRPSRNRQSLSRLYRLKLDHGHIKEEQRAIFQEFSPPSHSLPIPALMTLLRHSCCRLFLTELSLPKALFIIPDRSNQVTSDSSERPWRQRELQQHTEDIRLAQECVRIITLELEQLKVVIIQQSPATTHLSEVETALVMDLISGLLRIRTLERLECRCKAYVPPGRWTIVTAPLTPPRLKHLNLSYLFASGSFWAHVLRLYGPALERLQVSLRMFMMTDPSLETSIQLYCPRLRQLIVESSPDVDSYSQAPKFRLAGLLAAKKTPTMTRGDTIQFNDSFSTNDDSGSSRITSLRIQKHRGHYGSIRCLLDGCWDLLEEIVIDQMEAPSKSAELEQLLSYRCSSRFSTFSVNCGHKGYLSMDILCKKSVPWPCAVSLRVLRLTVGRAPDVLSASLAESFYELVGHCTQLEELAIGYTIDQGSEMSDMERYDPLDPLDSHQFWDLTVSSSSWSTETPILMRARGCLQYLSGLSKLRKLSLTRGDLWSKMGQKEVEFMANHWSLLHTIEIAVKSRDRLRRYRAQPHWQWLIQNRWDLNLKSWSETIDDW